MFDDNTNSLFDDHVISLAKDSLSICSVESDTHNLVVNDKFLGLRKGSGINQILGKTNLTSTGFPSLVALSTSDDESPTDSTSKE